MLSTTGISPSSTALQGPSQAQRRSSSDFDSYYQDAGHAAQRDRQLDAAPDRSVAPAKEQDAASPSSDRAEARREDNDQQTERADDARQADRADDARQSQRAQDGRQAGRPTIGDRPQKPEADPTKGPGKHHKADAQAKPDDAQAQAAADPNAPQAQDATPLNAQDTLALMLATGAQLAQPKAPEATTQGTTPDGQPGAVAAVGPDGKPLAANAATPVVLTAAQQAQATAAAQAQAQAGKPDGGTFAQLAQAIQAAGQQAKGAQPGTPGTDKPATPGAAQAANGGLGPIKLTVEKASGVESPVQAALEAATHPDPQGPIAPAAKLDGAASLEMAPQILDTLATTDDLPTPAADALPDPNALQAASNTQAPADAKPIDALQAPDKAQETSQAHDIMRQVLERSDQVKSNINNSVKLQLYPEHLGKMEIRVTSHQGVISAQLSADSQHVKAMLEGQVVALQRSFQEMGLKVDKVEVTLNSANLQDFAGNTGGNAFAQGQGQQQQSPQGQPRMGTGLGYEQWLPEAPSSEVYARPEHETAIDYVA